MSSITSFLPNDILNIIKENLDLKSRFNCQLVCKQWSSIFKDDKTQLNLNLRSNFKNQNFTCGTVHNFPKSNYVDVSGASKTCRISTNKLLSFTRDTLPHFGTIDFAGINSCLIGVELVYFYRSNLFYKFDVDNPCSLFLLNNESAEIQIIKDLLTFHENFPEYQNLDFSKQSLDIFFCINILKNDTTFRLINNSVTIVSPTKSFFILTPYILYIDIWNDTLLTFEKDYGVSFYEKKSEQNYERIYSITDPSISFTKVHDSAIFEDFLIVSYNEDKVSVIDLLRKDVLITKTLSAIAIKILESAIVFKNKSFYSLFWNIPKTKETIKKQKIALISDNHLQSF